MAINTFEKQCDKITSKCSSNHSKGCNLPSCHMLKLCITTDGSITSSDSKSSKLRDKKSPYLTGDSVQLLSRITEKKLYTQHKKGSDFVSSFPLAASIYRANSDEFKSQKRASKKVKKSVLTLPNESSEIQQICTVSDTNDSKYFDDSKYNQNLRATKRFLPQNRKSRVRNKNYEFYDRDARYCSQMNINLDCSSTDMINQFTGDGKRITGKFGSKNDSPNDGEFDAHDVWAVLRNINRFQFRPSPPISEDSIQTVKKKKIRNKRKNNRKDTRVIETCRTEEFAYISSYDVDSKSPMSFSPTSSFDRITVIDKQDEFSQICKEFENNVIKSRNVKPKNRQSNATNNKKKSIKNTVNTKTIGQKSDEQQAEQQKAIDLDRSPITSYQTVLENPETLVEINYNNVAKSQKKHQTTTSKFLEPSVFNNIVNHHKESSGTLHSGSSKAEISTSTNLRKDYNFKSPNSDSSPQVKGITKVILNKARMNEIQNKKSRMEPGSPTIPKMTQTEIKRRLANLKFPIVILGKDQLCQTSVQVMEYEPPHLQVLDQQIWPFMQDWYDSNGVKRDNENGKIEKADHKPGEYILSKIRSQPVERKNLRKQNETNKQATGKDKHINEEATTNKKKSQKRPVAPNEIIKIKQQNAPKPKPIHQLKDKMLKLLYKNTSAKEIDEQNKLGGQVESSTSCARSLEVKQPHAIIKVDAATETFMKYELLSRSLSRNTDMSPRLDTKRIPIVAKQPWAKAKWASDFIETVIKKIRSGVYYNQENKNLQKIINLKEVSIQTVLTANDFNMNEKLIQSEIIENKSNENLSEVIPKDLNKYAALPGFDEILPALEIKTLNMKEVAVKHCTTNVMVQFDIAVPTERQSLNYVQKSSNFVPLAVTKSHTKIFKCKTTIINAMLPAEICSLLPKIIKNIIDSNKPPVLSTSAAPYLNDGLLYTISELSNSESQDIFKSSLSPIGNLSPILIKLLRGIFSNVEIRKPPRLCVPKLNYVDSRETTDLLTKVSVRHLFPCHIDPISVYLSEKRQIPEQKAHTNVSQTKTCMSLQVYEGPNTSLNKFFEKCNGLIGKIWFPKLNIRMNINPTPLSLVFHGDKIIVNMTNNYHGFEEKSSIIISNINFNNVCKEFKQRFAKDAFPNSPFKAIDSYTDVTRSDKDFNHMQNTLSHMKTRKKKFINIYKKCKSTSNISSEKNCTLLSKIINLEDFLQALGTGKLLSSVFDGLSGKKILSSILEMKNWITEISQRQAMLVLLLTNKKDTPNLIRFRPILLQGIAVNRITRASELDMEIEVIERENFNKFSKFEGIPYMSECVENHNILLEEMYWIAKTTASDYQKPFTEASEKLLKSLLEKRKKLNPSYLRVMARYVGLGLLKSPNKN